MNLMETNETTSEIVRTPTLRQLPPQDAERRPRNIVALIIVVIALLVILLGVAIYYLMQPTTPTDQIRDVFIIIVALESLVIGVALIVLIVQLASLIINCAQIKCVLF